MGERVRSSSGGCSPRSHGEGRREGLEEREGTNARGLFQTSESISASVGQSPLHNALSDERNRSSVRKRAR